MKDGSVHDIMKHIKGFSRVQIVEDGESGKQEVVGDSGWHGPNTITNNGFLNYLVKLLGSSAGSLQVGFIALGTGGTTATDATALAGEITSSTQRQGVTFANVGSTTAQFTATFASGDSFLAGASNLSNIGLFQHSSTNAIFAGNTYASSSCDTNQSVNVTYQIRFS